MKPPYKITSRILHLVASVSQKTGEINAHYLVRQPPHLRKQNKIKTIHSSLQIEGNRLSEEQVTALLENKRILGSQKDIQEVMNAAEVYDNLPRFRADSEKSFLSAHKLLMKNLVPDAGRYRKSSVGIVKGKRLQHVAPPHANVPGLMKDLLRFVSDKKEIALIRSCVFHYEMEFIHPFMDGNGRMGRLWQTLILMEDYPVFEFLPFESLISKDSKAYYKALALSDNSGQSAPFIEYMLGILDDSLSALLSYNGRVLTETDRMHHFAQISPSTFTRKDYMNVFKELSPSTASRDLKKGIASGIWEKEGDKKTTVYRMIKNR